jgi:hypothetical protein
MMVMKEKDGDGHEGMIDDVDEGRRMVMVMKEEEEEEEEA